MNSSSLPPADGEFEITEQELLAGDLTAAMLQSQLSEHDVLPPPLAARIAATGEALVRAQSVPPVVNERPRALRGAPSRLLAWSGWLAAAALLVLFVRANRPASAVGAITTTVAAADPRNALLDSLLAAPGLVRRAWTPTTDSAATAASGEVLWDPDTGRGIMRFARLAANNPAEWQYQLWIFDAERDERFPVDGGVFDIPSGTAEVLIPIRARLTVGQAALFAVTIEAPGGVVVSNRERIAVTASL
ncbi:anti-sigma factor domain-containing protein [Gemmatimonas sp.]